MEWWAFEIMAIFAGLIGVSEQAAHIILMNLCAFMFMLSLGMQTATVTTVGQEIGAVNIKRAKEYFGITNAIAAALILISTSVVYMNFS